MLLLTIHKGVCYATLACQSAVYAQFNGIVTHTSFETAPGVLQGSLRPPDVLPGGTIACFVK
jgi:hypothetical protein